MTTLKRETIGIIGAGITGLWQAYMFAKNGYSVHLAEKDAIPFASAASLYAGVMLAPFCEEESAEPVIRELGLRSMELWFEHDPNIQQKGSLVLALPREQRELMRFARATHNHVMLAQTDLAELEPDLEGRFDKGLYYNEEAHLDPSTAMAHLLRVLQDYDVQLYFGQDKITQMPKTDWVIDCRGIAAQDQLPMLRAVRGERIIIRATDVRFQRPIRLLHPRFPIYIVPWLDDYYMIGATTIESDDHRNITLRSALELLSTAYSLHPGLAEAEIIEFGAGLRPAFPDNIPKIIPHKQTIYVNGMYRHGFLLAPALAELVLDYTKTGQTHAEIFVEDYFKR